MWYEYQMINECLNSVQNALELAQEEVRLRVCLNRQTYLEKYDYRFDHNDPLRELVNHPLYSRIEFIEKNDAHPFYNIADWSRDEYYPDAKYNVWGETDTIMPREFFRILEMINVDVPHVLSFASRPMWDNSWDVVTHEALQGYSKPCQCPEDNHRADCIELLDAPWKYKDLITQDELDKFNEGREITIQQVPLKVDGSLLCLSGDLPHPFIPEDMHFVREDTCAQEFFRSKGISQLCVKSILKGHNYKHPNKRVGTSATRDDEVFKQYAEQSQRAMMNFLTVNRN